MTQTYPIFLDLGSRLAVIVGGGNVAARKAEGLLSAGAKRVRCVAPHFCDAVPASIERIAENYADRHLEGACIVFAATDNPAVNAAIVQDCRRRGIWVNRTDSADSDPGDFSTPARFDAGPITITVSAGSPALSAAIRDSLITQVDPRFVAMAEAMRELRPAVKRSNLDANRRADALRALAEPQALDALQSGGITSLRKWLAARYPELHQ